MSGPLDSLQQPVCGIKRFLDGSYRGTPLDPERADKVGSVHHHERTGHRARAANLAGEPPEKVAAVTSRDAARKRKERDMRIDFELSGGGTVYLFRPLTRAARAWVEDHLPADDLVVRREIAKRAARSRWK